MIVIGRVEKGKIGGFKVWSLGERQSQEAELEDYQDKRDPGLASEVKFWKRKAENLLEQWFSNFSSGPHFIPYALFWNPKKWKTCSCLGGAFEIELNFPLLAFWSVGCLKSTVLEDVVNKRRKMTVKDEDLRKGPLGCSEWKVLCVHGEERETPWEWNWDGLSV